MILLGFLRHSPIIYTLFHPPPQTLYFHLIDLEATPLPPQLNELLTTHPPSHSTTSEPRRRCISSSDWPIDRSRTTPSHGLVGVADTPPS
ncbi:hypothetical protein ElyMa_003870600 [Elysia marginata]|uniref:Uncharacterized protein n=1 Tax=Elysia marginata TaxID=1093978 RepID=A0AAV4FLI7_9GAST|nr:hypothetical protein ElyMa_003870600 [Elysia marginata]